jgi:dihydropyrimidine dehydrogenase (NAD+) subunit PreA
VRIPLIASGGLDTWRDVADAIMWGATAVGVCCAIMWHGWEVVEQMKVGLQDFMARRGWRSPEEFRGLALKHFTTPDKAQLVKGHALVDEQHCIGCGRCLKPGHCEAITMANDKARVDTAKCIACGVCRSLCPTGAISYAVDEAGPSERQAPNHPKAQPSSV